MPALDDTLKQKLAVLDAKHLRRVPVACEQLAGMRVRKGAAELVSFSGNDYLGLSRHPKVLAAAEVALKRFGAGAGASRLVTGNHPLYEQLEATLAAYKGTEAACVFGSGYLANIGIIPALVGKNDLIVADRLAHACMLDAARLSDASFFRFAHNNLNHLRTLLEQNRADFQNCLILTETIFSMDGDAAPLEDLAALATEFDCWLMTDDAHGLGLLHPAWSNPVPLRMGTLSKSAGSYGGYLCASATVIDYVKSTCRSLIYSTGLPPATVAASIAALEVMRDEPGLGKKALANAQVFCEAAGLAPSPSAIVPVLIGEADDALTAAALLEEKGFLVAAIRPPTVPEHTARLRVAFSALHEEKDILALAAIVKAQGWGKVE